MKITLLYKGKSSQELGPVKLPLMLQERFITYQNSL